jgi:hypothetical protein
MIITANNNSLANITALPSSISGGGMTLISEQTASSSANLSFTSGIDSTYDSYVFKFYNIHPSASASFMFNMSTDSGSNYNVTKTTTSFRAFHAENDSFSGLGYDTGDDLAQSTAFQDLTGDSIGTDNDSSVSGSLQLFNPSSTTFVKHFIVNVSLSKNNNEAKNQFVAGYGNTTSSVNAVQFKMDSGNIDSGVIKLYGIS